jgi:hypothetical protein
MFQNNCGLKFLECVEDMQKLLDMMRVSEASNMSMKSPGAMMVAPSA